MARSGRGVLGRRCAEPDRCVRSLDRQGSHARLSWVPWRRSVGTWKPYWIRRREMDQDPADSAHGAKAPRTHLPSSHRAAGGGSDGQFGRASGPQLLAFDEFAAGNTRASPFISGNAMPKRMTRPSPHSATKVGREGSLLGLAGLVRRRLGRSLRPGRVRPPGQVVGEVCKCVFERFARAGRLSGFVPSLGDRADG